MDIMEPYFKAEESAYAQSRGIKDTMYTLAERYIASNQKKDLVLRSFYENGFAQDFDGHFLMDFNKMYPDAQDGEYAYAFAYAYIAEERCAYMSFQANSPVWIYVNGEEVFKTKPINEALNRMETYDVHFKKGKNTFFVKCRKNELGFGCLVGDGGIRGFAITYLNPTEQHFGKMGWAYSKTVKEDIFKEMETFPKIGDNSGMWLPKTESGIEPENVLENKDGYVYAVTYFDVQSSKELSFGGSCDENCTIYIDGEKCFNGVGKIGFLHNLNPGKHIFTAEIMHKKDKKIGFKPELPCEYYNDVRGSNGKWLYIMLDKPEDSIKGKIDFYYVYDGNYWKTDEKDTSVRLTQESRNFGQWNYPVGVVMYGLSAAAELLDSSRIKEYIDAHMNQCCGSYPYALWDTEKYGRAWIMHQMIGVDALDFCGSCGNALLETLGYTDKTKLLADDIADYIENKQERLKNGMFYREMLGNMHEQSIWADDLYMSVPFLCRYYKANGDEKYLNDAVNQFKCFREYLYMPDKKVMSHVYNLNYGKKNKIPWGRGNGWVIFALSELLQVLPAEHEKRDELIDFYHEISEGYLNYQDKTGLWHQVIDEPEAYLESSCTAMFVCGFARGIRNGWLTDEKFVRAAYKGWEGLCKYCIDSFGNLYGVCLGSALSFRRDYYVKELPWRLNDTHGTGIVLLAGSEILKMEERGVK